MKRVLFISPQPFFQWRGSPIRVGFNVQALAELGYKVDLLTLPFGEKKEITGVRIIRTSNIFLSRNVPIGPSLLKAMFDVLLLFKGLWLIFINRYDVIHAIEDAGVIGVILAGIAHCKFIFEKHSDPSSYRKGPLRNLVMLLYAKVERFSIKHADTVITTGHGLAKQALAMGYSMPVHHIPDIPSSLTESSEQKTAEIRKKLGAGKDELLITYVGSFAVYQGIDMMFAAIPEVIDKYLNAKFVIIGGTADEIAEKREWLSKKGVKSRLATDVIKDEGCVIFIRKVPPDELPNYLSASDVLLSPRLAGINTPLKLLDYLKAGRAIVATDIESNVLILDQTTAVIVKPEASDFSKGICRLLEDKNLRVGLGENGQKLIKEKYNFIEFKNKLSLCYEKVLEDGNLA